MRAAETMEKAKGWERKERGSSRCIAHRSIVIMLGWADYMYHLLRSQGPPLLFNILRPKLHFPPGISPHFPDATPEAPRPKTRKRIPSCP